MTPAKKAPCPRASNPILNTFISTPTPGLFYTEASISKISDLLETILSDYYYTQTDSFGAPYNHSAYDFQKLQREARKEAEAAVQNSASRKCTILGHTVALTSNLIAQHQNYDAGTIAQIIPVIFKALDEASR